ncbi:prephenate-dependent tRNA uridine(34) hydroxylase TrhP [Ostreibacterium oceani]|uniref:tRNA 5-hydroxyuridine modification protein YegQ n=1 Tax=Ostreibacterium oceani TaxID=2654998 RepID=A0A6N7EU78_9GAMM|nr:tRNA 5-hydroxyuridine modification protein YegQ [Ostreibacterium oceani]MPV85165.1 tRNA 5-hydroxyuridine modification protein YegQ [Ostreibacterium oceani]
MNRQVELLSPAGTLKSMEYALAYGADAVYAGAPRYSLRVRNNDFIGENLEKGIRRAHELGKRFFLTTNIIPHNKKIKTFMDDIRPTIELGPDALIMADPGLMMLVKEAFPEVEIHLSVQANTINYAAAKFWQSAGVSRVILSRELSIDEIKEIKDYCPDLEIEVFVHGALCIAYSGRCLLSGYFNHRDPNQGTCTNSCRWKYKTIEGSENTEGVYVPNNEAEMHDAASAANTLSAEQVLVPNLSSSRDESGMPAQGNRDPRADGIYFLEEENRPGELMEISEDEHGTYIMNSKDLRAIEHVHALVDAGVDCLKIEGRTKSHYYVARTAQLYRQAIDDALAGRAFNETLIGKLENLANRGYTDGFFQRHHTQDYQNYIENISHNANQKFVGEIVDYDTSTGLSEVIIKNKLSVGDKVELITPSGTADLMIDHIENLKGEKIEVAPGSGHVVKIPLGAVNPELALLARYVS